ncbi:hypothetical protein [Herbiconiux solani]|uniref:hypothetical protein n=1 Tax=Herbiconiux solani TaxID=661329 RepID=UPI0008256341|nr:hypothetical protein [Herbiconiux solani]
MSRNKKSAGQWPSIVAAGVFIAGMTVTVVIKGIALGPTLTWLAIPMLAGFIALVVVLLLVPSRRYMRAHEAAARLRSGPDSPYVIVALTWVDTRRAVKKLGFTSPRVPRYTPVSVSSGMLTLWAQEDGRLRPAAEISAPTVSSIEAGAYPAAGFAAKAVWIHTAAPQTQFPLMVMDPSSAKRPKAISDLDRLEDIAKTLREKLLNT